MVEIVPTPIFGGALVIHLPKQFRNMSDLLPVPDN